MIAFAILSLVSIVTVTTMNMGVATNEQSLELVTARSELNAQAEALRFIHSSYISELTLPRCSEVSTGEKCQQYRDLWKSYNGFQRQPQRSKPAYDRISAYGLQHCL